MTLGRRLTITSALLIAALVIDAAVALVGIFAIRSDVNLLQYEHRELQLIREIAVEIAEVTGALRDDVPDRPFLLASLKSAIDLTRHLRALQTAEEHHDPAHAQRERRLIERTITGLNGMVAQVEGSLHDLSGNHRELAFSQGSELLDHFKALAAETALSVNAAHAAAASKIRWTVATTTVICIAMIVAAVVLGFTQYRTVMRPLRHLRSGVRSVSRGRFDQVLSPAGDREFVELADDFNRMAAELHSLYTQLEQKVAIKSRELVRSERLASVGFLAAGVAHEINNPLGIISTFAELSLRDLDSLPSNPSIDEVKRSLGVMYEESFRCKAITEKLLSLSRRGDDARGPVVLANVMTDVVVMVTRLSTYRDRQVTTELSALSGIPVIGNEQEIRQVLLNVLVNALEAVSTGGRVDIKGCLDRDSATITITDDGCGMAPETMEHIFEPFYSRKVNGHQGIGLGLSICHAIVASHCGRITATSDGPGKGSRFTVAFPMAAAAAPAIAVSLQEHP